ncbi:alpha-protein kinase 1 [Drosophila montana]|uniref:alpha-protein kinase 1 n=1 Tax=Drosophila montana TaxID=40370 RepID=UPI00313BA1E6
MSLMVVKVASTALYQQQQQPQQQQQQLLNHVEPTVAETTSSTESDNHGDSPAQAAERLNIEKMRAKLQQLQHEQQQQYRLQQQQMHLHLQQMHQQQMQMQLHANDVDAGVVADVETGAAGETAYLLERADDVAPIYGTWRTKARRPQPPGNMLQHATSMQLNGPADGDANANGVDDNHLYERLPRRSVTMTPLRDVLRDQLPRPPRLSTQRPPSSALLRRQYSETPGTLAMRDDFKPKPFHFPFDGPLPEQFKKGEAERQHGTLNNIQDILHNLHINSVMPSKMPQMMTAPSLVMMPTGLHIAGSYKNLKSSGIANFFRGKRNKKQMQFSIPMPMFPMGMPMPMYGGAPHQRVAIEQLYPYKPRSPQDINLLALQQAPNSKPSSKKKNKKQQQQEQSNYNMLLEHGTQQHLVVDPFLQNFPPIIALNATRQPQHKRIPFKLNLDIYPVLPPSRPTSVLRNPFHGDYALPSAGPLTASNGPIYAQPQGLYQSPFKFPTQPPSHLPMIFPEHGTRYSQQQQQQQQHQQQQQALYQSPKFAAQQQQNSGPEDCIYAQQANGNGNTGPVDSHSNQIMLHLNVFPKQKPTTPMRASTNPFYSHNFGAGLQRNTFSASEQEQPLPKPPSPIEPRQVAPAQSQPGNSSLAATTAQPQQNQTQQQQQQQQPGNHSISRSDNLSLIDFEHPIVAAEVPQLPHPAALTGNPPNHGRYSVQGDHFRYHKTPHIDQLAAEAQTASLFRFPVEDLIQFQVDDAL